MVEAKNGENNPMYGKRHTDESRRKISVALKGSPLVNNVGANNPMYGRKHTDEARSKMSGPRPRMASWNRGKKCPEISMMQMGENNSFYGRKHSAESIKKMCETRLNSDCVFPIKDTSIEVALQEELDRRNIKYEKHIPICGVCKPDIVFPSRKIALFADGNYWHSEDFDGGKVWRRDRRQEEALRGAGWTVLRFWGSEIRGDVSRCIDEIEGVLG